MENSRPIQASRLTEPEHSGDRRSQNCRDWSPDVPGSAPPRNPLKTRIHPRGGAGESERGSVRHCGRLYPASQILLPGQICLNVVQRFGQNLNSLNTREFQI
jgi:hypothetical protein